MQGHGIRVIAAHPHQKERFVFQTDFRHDCCLVFGSEGNGIAPEILKQCAEVVAIPMPPMVDSLNVASAAAVFLYEASRQRRAA